jgi:hypothetical protein
VELRVSVRQVLMCDVMRSMISTCDFMLRLFIVFADLFISARQFCTGYEVFRFDYGLFPNDYGTLSYYAWSIYRLIPFVCVHFLADSSLITAVR